MLLHHCDSTLRHANVGADIIRAEQMGQTIDVKENVYTITSLKRRKEAVNALEKAIGAQWTLSDSGFFDTLGSY